MELIDLIIYLLIGAGVVVGFFKGGVKQLATIAGLLVGLYAARLLYEPLAEQLCPSLTQSMTFAQILSFLAIWIAIPILFLIVAALLTRTLQAIHLGGVNRLFGALLGGCKALLLVSLFINVIDLIDKDSHFIDATKKRSSALYYPVKHVTSTVFPLIKEVTKNYI